MGTWGVSISSNDFFKDIYQDFIDLFNDNKSIKEITEKLILENSDSINDPDESNEFWFALAKAQWDCGSLDSELLKRIEKIIITGSDIERWKNLDATEKDLKKREQILNDFLQLLKTQNAKPKKPKKKKLYDSIFKKGDCLSINLGNGKYGAAIVLTEQKNTDFGLNLLLILNYFNDSKLEQKNFEKQTCFIEQKANGNYEPFLIYCYSSQFKKKKFDYENIGNIKISRDYDNEKGMYFYGHWDSVALRLNYFYQNTDNVLNKVIKVDKVIKKGLF